MYWNNFEVVFFISIQYFASMTGSWQQKLTGDTNDIDFFGDAILVWVFAAKIKEYKVQFRKLGFYCTWYGHCNIYKYYCHHKNF